MSRVLTLHTVTNPASCSLTSEHRVGLRNLGRLTWISISVWPMLVVCHIFYYFFKNIFFCYDLIQRILFFSNSEGKCCGYWAREEAVDGWYLFCTPCKALQIVDEMENEQDTGSDATLLPGSREVSGAVQPFLISWSRRSLCMRETWALCCF